MKRIFNNIFHYVRGGNPYSAVGSDPDPMMNAIPLEQSGRLCSLVVPNSHEVDDLESRSESFRGPLANNMSRQRLEQLIASQRQEQPLQLLENLGRADRQVATRAAYFGAQAGIDFWRDSGLADAGFSSTLRDSGYVETGLPFVFRERYLASYIEPTYRSLSRPNTDGSGSGEPVTSAKFSAPMTESEMLTHWLSSQMAPRTDEDTHHGGQARFDPATVNALVLPEHRIDNASYVPAIQDSQQYQPTFRSNFDAPSLVRGAHMPTLNAADLASTVIELAHLPHADFIHQIAARSPESAIFFNFAAHALLLKDSVKAEPTERYPYIDDEGLLAEKVRANGTPFLPTFLEGVERDFNATNPLGKGWRVQIDGQWQAGQTRQEVLQHVFLQALQHLQTDRLADPAMPVYPLVAYELLADAIGVAVPEYLKQREQAIHATLAGNRQRIEERTAQRALDRQQLLAERAAGEVRQQQDLRENGVTNVFQMRFCYAGYQRELRNASVDTLFMLPSDSRYGAIVAKLDERLTHTHDQQAISSRNHTGRGTDNRCWLRSSWLSVFAALRPDELAERLRAMSTPIAAQHYAYKDAPVLQAIAQYYRDDPVAFMQGGAPGNRRSAHLGPNDAVSALLPAQDGMTLPEGSIEEFLHGLQLDIAAAFRAGDPSYMSEIESLWLSTSAASSNLPVTLHRAFGLPILVVETGVSRSEGEQEQQTNRSVQLRVAAPLGSDLARRIEQLPHDPDQHPVVTNALFAAFKDLPVLRLTQDHYDLYMPKASSAQDGAIGSQWLVNKQNA